MTLPFQTLEWTGDALLLLDQRALPEKETMLRFTDAPGVAGAIRTMVVRGAPAIGVTAAFGLVLSVRADGAAGRPWREAFREAAET
ncbi:MAG: S-methyl-5-thioribose-1-phosphate isomerase, partial [Deltaproteobacteria bacterium]|nr:S-methyl-5-thioribose-1-phosphate isomerase [Deltaproteobacteria bacterium]